MMRSETTPESSIRLPQDWPLIVMAGPLVGTLLAFLPLPFFEPLPETDIGIFVFGAILVLSVGWLLGLLPAALAAFLWSRARRIGFGLSGRILACLAIGAVAPLIAIWPVALLLSRTLTLPALSDLFWLSAIGAAALFITARPWRVG